MQAIADYFVAAHAVVLGDVSIASGVNIWYGCILRGDLARITLAERVNLQDGVIVHTDWDAPQILEEGVVVGHGAILHGSRIGRDTLVGMGARLLSGSVIGEESIVAAGSVVPEGRILPPRSLVMGLPAKVVRPVREEEVQRTRTTCARYLEMARRHARGEFPPPWQQESR